MGETQVLNDAELRAIVRGTRTRDELHRIARELLVAREKLATFGTLSREELAWRTDAKRYLAQLKSARSILAPLVTLDDKAKRDDGHGWISAFRVVLAVADALPELIAALAESTHAAPTESEREKDLEAFLLNASAWLEHGDAGKLTKDGLRTHAARLMQPIEAEHAARRESSPEGAQRT